MRFGRDTVVHSVLALSCFCASAHAKTAAEWRELSIYQVLTDRFALPDGSAPDCWIRDYCGGTWKGIENRLDYIQGMGFSAIWISPVIHNIEGNTTWGYAFHGYWGDNPYELNEHFGTPDDLKSLSAALHNRGMSLMVDIVINHLAFNGSAQDVDYSLFPPPFDTPSAFHPVCDINYGNQSSIESCWLVTSPPSLPDVESENATVFDAMVNSVVDIVKTYNVDGIRLDTARHIPKDKLAQFQDAVGVFVTGETLNDSVQYVSQYQGPLDSVLNYPLWYPLVDAILGKYSFDYLGGLIMAEQTNFSDVNVLTNFLDNHDQPRLASRPGDDVIRDENAVTFLMSTSGIPVVYYGFEQRFNGGYDPINREPLWTSNYNTNATLYQYIATLHRIRSLAAAACHANKQDFFSSNVEVLGTGQEYMALQRGPLVFVVSNVGENGTTNSFVVSNSQFEPSSEIIDLLSCTRATVGSRREFRSTPNGGKARVWIRTRQKGAFCS